MCAALKRVLLLVSLWYSFLCGSRIFFPSRDRHSNEKFLVLEMHQNGHSHHLCGVHPQSVGNCVGGFGRLVNEFIRHSRVEENTGSLS